MRSVGQTDRHDEANSRFSQVCEGAYERIRTTKPQLEEELQNKIPRTLGFILSYNVKVHYNSGHACN